MFVGEFYSETGQHIYTLWNSKHKNVRTFGKSTTSRSKQLVAHQAFFVEMGTDIIPRFFQVNFESGLGHMQVVVEQVGEYYNVNLPNVVCVLEAPRASIIYHFDSGIQVRARLLSFCCRVD